MPTTPIYALRYPAATDPADVPLDLQELATDVEAGLVTVRQTLVSALPGSPTDGQVVLYQNAAMAALGVAWQLRYRAAASGSYKWEFIGGAALRHAIGGDETGPTNNTWHDLATVGPTLTVPLAGDYEIQAFAFFTQNSATANRCRIGVCVTPVATDPLVWGSCEVAAQFQQGSPSTQEVKTGLAAGNELRMRYLQVNPTAIWTDRTMTIRPVRVG